MAQDLFAMFDAAMGEALPKANAGAREPAPTNAAGGVDLFEALGHKPKPRK